MGRKKGRNPGVRYQTTSELVLAVNRDFQNRAMEQSARERLSVGIPDVRRAGRMTRLEADPDGGTRLIAYGPVIEEPIRPRTPETQRRARSEHQRLKAALQRSRSQPPKYPELDAAMAAAVKRGESPTKVVTAAIQALRLAEPHIRPTPALRLRFLDRLKKQRRKTR